MIDAMNFFKSIGELESNFSEIILKLISGYVGALRTKITTQKYPV
jgi:hypothetical protein